jgi:outer membrane lipoprotein-sorting protein
MKRFLGAVLAVSLVGVLTGLSRADDKDATPILDKAIKALGGEEKLSKIKAYSVKTKGTITFGGNDNEFTAKAIHEGLDKFRSEFEGNFGGNDVKGVTVLAGDKGWRKFGDMDMEIEGDQLTNEKRTVYLSVIPTLIVQVKGKGFKTEATGEEKVGDKPAAVVKVTGPEGKDFKLFFDKESGLPVKMVAKVMGFGGDEFEQETTYENYKEFDGIKKATKSEAKRDGEKFVATEITEFKVLEKVESDAFSQPK